MRLALLLLSLSLAACTSLSSGDPCDATGDGFTRVDPCNTQCIEWDVLCADGSTAVPSVCAGAPCSNNPNACANGWGCVQVNGTDSVCLPQEFCPGGYGAGQPTGLAPQSTTVTMPPDAEGGEDTELPSDLE